MSEEDDVTRGSDWGGFLEDPGPACSTFGFIPSMRDEAVSLKRGSFVHGETGACMQRVS